jgi:hypothetical protein
MPLLETAQKKRPPVGGTGGRVGKRGKLHIRLRNICQATGSKGMESTWSNYCEPSCAIFEPLFLHIGDGDFA